MTQRSLNGTFKIQRSLTGTGILTSVLYGANNLSDVQDKLQSRINLGLTGKLDINTNSTNYLSISNQFGSTTNETLTINASTTPTPDSLVAYDLNGNLVGNYITSYADIISNGNLYSNTLNCFSISSRYSTNQNFIILNNDLQFGYAGAHIQDSNGSNSITFDGIGNITFGGTISGTNATFSGYLQCSDIQNQGTLYLRNLSTYPSGSTNPVILKSDVKFFSSNMHIRDANNNNTLTFDNAGNVLFYNTISINGNSILINPTNTFYIQQQGLVAPGTQPYITIIGSSGNIGIGTSSINYKLDVGGSIRTTNTIYTNTIQANTTGNPIVTNSDIKLGSANMHIRDSGGNNALSFDGASSIAMNTTGVFYTNYFDVAANFNNSSKITGTFYFGSNNLSSVANIQANSIQNGNAAGGLVFKNTSGTTTATVGEDSSLSIGAITASSLSCTGNISGSSLSCTGNISGKIIDTNRAFWSYSATCTAQPTPSRKMVGWISTNADFATSSITVTPASNGTDINITVTGFYMMNINFTYSGTNTISFFYVRGGFTNTFYNSFTGPGTFNQNIFLYLKNGDTLFIQIGVNGQTMNWTGCLLNQVS